MEFLSRIKKEMTEGMARAIFEDAGYRVIESGVEKVFRELACMAPEEYVRLSMPETMRKLPDFMVMTREQDRKYLIEVKYREQWSKSVLTDLRAQVQAFGEMVLVCVNATAANPRKLKDCPSRFIRCCPLRVSQGEYQMELRKNGGWVAVDQLENDDALWWMTWPLWEKFDQLQEEPNSKTLFMAVQALRGILAEA